LDNITTGCGSWNDLVSVVDHNESTYGP